VYNAGVAGNLTPCPRAHCGGALLCSWGEPAHCLLCGRSLSPPTVGTRRQREPATRRAPREDPYVAVARRVLAIPERVPQWDPDLQAYVIDELDIPEAESLMATAPEF